MTMRKDWDRLALAADQKSKEWEYWQKQLAGEPVKGCFPFDYIKNEAIDNRLETARTPVIQTVTHRFKQPLLSRIREIGGDSEHTLHIILAAGLAALIYKTTGIPDMIVGTPIYKQAVEADFINTILPLRIQFREDSTFKDLLLQIRQTVSEAVAHQGYPLEFLADRLKISGSEEGAALFDTAILLENIHHKKYLRHLTLPMIFSCLDSPAGLEISVDYDARLYRETTLRRLLSHFQEMLFQVLAHIDKKLVLIELLTEEEKERLLGMFNCIDVEYPRDKTIDELFREQARQKPDHTALLGPVPHPGAGEFTGNVSLTYNHLNHQSDQLACLLTEKGVRADTIVAIMAERSIEVVIGMLAILKAGGAYLPMDPDYPAERLNYILADSGAEILVTSGSLEEKAKKIKKNSKTIFIDSHQEFNSPSSQLLNFSSSNLLAFPPSQPANLAYVIYTSGTTGKPKGVLVKHENVVRLLFNRRFQFDFNEDDIWTLFHSFCFDFSVWEMYGALLYGGRLVVATRIMARDPGEFLQLLAAHGVTVLNQTPSAFYQLMAESLKTKAPSSLKLRYVIFGGEALQPGKLAAWHEKYPAVRLVNMFGITETTVHVTFREIGTQEIASGISDIGKPIPTLSLHVLNPYRLLLPIGIPGELCVGGKGVARGYLNRPELTAEKFVESPFDPGERLYCSGDLARIMESGDLEYLGRMDHQVQVRGYRIELGEIESQLLTHEHIREAVAVAGTGSDNSYFLCAYVVPEAVDSPVSLDPAALQEYLFHRLPDYMIPHYFVRLDAIPLTANGKVDRSQLPDPQVLPEGRYVAPRTHEEQVMALVWGEVLALEKVGIDHNFFNLGGDSIKAIRLISAINARLDSHLKILDLYTHGTIRQLVTLVDRPESFNRLALKQKVTAGIRALKKDILAEKPRLADIVEDIFPMSDIEKGILFYYLKHMGTGIYHDQFVYPLNYLNFDRQRFETALSLLIKKHAILRTGYNTEDFEEPVHLVYRDISLPVLYDDLSRLSAAEKKAYIEKLLARDRQEGFDYNVAPLWRMVFLSMGHDHYYLLFIFHHAILDGWSAASMMMELQKTYLELKANSSYRLPPLKLSYKDAVVEEMVEKQNPQTLAYWKKELQWYQRLEFSETVKSKAELEPMKFYRIQEGSKLVKQINRIAAQYQTSFKNLCFGAYVLIMNLFSYEDDLVVGCVTNNRPGLLDGDKILGCFLNTVPVRMKIPRGITWEKYIQLVDQKMMEVKLHEGLSLFEIALAVGEKSKDRNPFFDTIFNFTDFHVFREANPQARDIPDDESSTGSAAEQIQQEPLSITDFQDTNTLFDFEVDITSGHLMLRPKYNTSAISEEMVKRCCQYFLSILEKYHSDPQGLVRIDEILPGEEKENLLYRFNDTTTPYEQHKTMHLLFEEQVARTPEQVALIDNDGISHLSYLELNRRANQLAHELLKPGVKPYPGPGELAAVVMDRCNQMVTAVMGILKAGMAYVPLEPYLPDLRIQKLLLALEVTPVLVTPSTYEKIVKIRQDLPCLRHIFCLDSTGSACSPQGDLHLEENSRENPAPLARAGDISYIIFTSGSTGVPKGVVETHRPVINVIRWVNQTFAVGEADKLLFIASLGFDLSVYDIFGILASGGVLRVVASRDIKDPRKLLGIIIKESITFWDSAPAALQQLAPFFHEVAETGSISRLRLVFLSGDWIPVTLPDALGQTFAGVRVISLGGATEATVWSNYYPIGKVDPSWPSIPYGKPIRNAGYYILDRHLDLCPLGVPGDLYIGGQCLASGYINDVELTAGKFISQPFKARAGAGKNQKPIIYKTGDMARWFADGNMQFLGRKDLQVKIRGFRVELGEIEAQLVDHPLISDGVVMDRLDAGGSKYLCAYFILKPQAGDGGIDKEELKEHLAMELPDYMIPPYFIPIDKIPMTANGKLDRKALPDPASIIAERIYAPPENDIQEKLVKIWSEVLLGKGAADTRIGIDDDFFDLGGHSLNATMTVSKIHRELNIKIPLAEIFNSPTIRELSFRVKTTGKDMYDEIKPVEKKEYYALSPAQNRLYILQQLDEGGTAYNSPQVMFLAGDFKPVQLQEAVQALIRRHESLRTSFVLLSGKTIQKIHEVEFKIEYIDPLDRAAGNGEHTGSTGNPWEQEIRDFVRPFDLSRAPCFRLGLIKTREAGHILMFDIHHIATDAVSHEIFVSELIALYNGMELPPLPIQYKDYSEWQNLPQHRELLSQQEAFWLALYGNGEEIPVLVLPYDYPRPRQQSFAGDYVIFNLGEEETGALQQLVAEQGITLHMLFMALFNVFLSKLSGQEDIIVGTPVAGRRHAELESVIGVFINTLPVRTYPTAEKTWQTFLKEVRETSLQAFENQQYQFENLVEKVVVHRDLGRNPLFDVLLDLQINPMPLGGKGAAPAELPGLKLSAGEYKKNTSKFDLTLHVAEQGKQLMIKLEYCTRLFKAETIQRFIRYFKKITAALIDDLHGYISDIDILCNEEKEQLLTEFNRTKTAYPADRTLHWLFEEQVERTPDHIALVGQILNKEESPGRIFDTFGTTNSITYKELNQKSHQLACRLQEKGVNPDTPVAIMVERTQEMMVGIFGILKAGGAYLPIDPEFPPGRIEYMLKDSKAEVLVTTTDLLEEGKKIRSWEGEMIFPDAGNERDCSAGMASAASFCRVSPFNLVYIIYTSGTTGKPKGVLLKHENLVNYIHWFTKQNDLRETDKTILTSSVAFDLGYTSLYPSIINGGELHILTKEVYLEPGRLLDYIKQRGITYLKVTPALFSIMVNSPGFSVEKCKTLRMVAVGGEAINVEDIEKAHSLCPHLQIMNHYGPTEATIGCVATFVDFDRFDEYKRHPVIGKPIHNTNVYILGKDLNMQPVGVPGELCISGTCLARGYLNRPAFTAGKFIPAFQNSNKSYLPDIYRTGDLARWLADGTIDLLGRVDHQVKIRGFRIELGEIESQLIKFDGIKEAVVTVRESGTNDKYLCAYLVFHSPEFTGSKGSMDFTALRQYLSGLLPEYMIPSYFVPVEHIPLTSNGKIDRKALPEPELTTTDVFVGPRNMREEKLTELWAEVLGIEKESIGIDTNFFELGGHSLRGTILAARICKEFDVQFPLNRVFSGPTIREFARYITGIQKSIYEDIQPIEKRDYYPQSSAQKRLFFLDQFEDIGTSYNMGRFLNIKGRIDKERYEDAFRALIARHESLRTSLHLVGNEPVQRVHSRVDFEIEMIQVPGKNGIQGEEQINHLAKSLIRPFDLANVPLLRAGLIMISGEESILFYDMHHIVSDGTSMGILINEFLMLYSGETLPLFSIQYKDFSYWQNHLLEMGKIKDQEGYWLNLLQDAHEIPLVNLPLDFPRPDIFTFSGDRYHFVLADEDSFLLRQLCSQSGTTLFMNLLAAFYVLLYKYTNQCDIIIGTSIAGRHHNDLQQVIGMFVNELVMRNQPVGEKSYVQFREEVKVSCLNAFENQDVQFEELVDKLNTRRDPGRNPIFDVCLVVQNFEPPGKVSSGVAFNHYGYENLTSKFDITLYVKEIGENIYFSTEYCQSLFKRETIERLSQHFVNLIKQIVRNPDRQLSGLEILSEAEKQQLLFDCNRSEAPYPETRTILQLFTGQVKRTPDHIAVVGQGAGQPDSDGNAGVQLTYRELKGKVNRVANYLDREKSIGSGSRVGILMDHSVDLIVVVLGVLEAGAAYVPLDASGPGERTKAIINDSGIGVIISQKQYIRNLNRLQWECDVFHTFLCMDSRDIYGEWEVEKNELMDEKLWEYVGETATDDITGGGWLTSTTGEPFTAEEMDEYGDNVLKKLSPLLHGEMRVLEIGCASGITMYRLAPMVGFYYGTDLSRVIIEKNRQRVEEEGLRNIALEALQAHQIDKLSGGNFDLVIINSVIQSFHGHNYLRQVINKAVDLIGSRGYLFIGDIMDQELKKDLVAEMVNFKQQHGGLIKEKGYKTKTDWSAELFVSRSFFEDVAVEIPGICDVTFSKKIHTIENELTRYRYDCLLEIDRASGRNSSHSGRGRHKYQEDMCSLEKYSASQNERPCQVQPGDIAYIIYTSGTTGRPKGVMIEHGSLVNYVWWGKERYINDKSQGYIFPFYTSFSFDLTVTSIFLPLVSGNTVAVYGSNRDQGHFPILDIVRQDRVDIIKATPSHLKLLGDELIGKNRCLKKFIVGGEQLEVVVARNIHRGFSGRVEIYNEYGPTEATVGCMIYRYTPGGDTKKGVPIGSPAANVSIYVLDRDLNPTPISSAGELYIGGLGLARGYINQAELTNEKFLRGSRGRYLQKEPPGRRRQCLYKTGDLARRLLDENIEFLGRIDDQVKIRGFRIETREIENRLTAHEEIKEAIVLLGRRSVDQALVEDTGDDYLCCYWVPETAQSSLGVSEIREYLSGRLPGYMIPSFFIRLDEIPLTRNGKVNRRALPEPGAVVVDENYMAPTNRVERKLAAIWSEVLGIKKETIGIHTNFFQLGGHSLRATIVVSRIHRELDVRIPLAEIFKTPTIYGLAQFIIRLEKDFYEDIKPIEKREYYPQSSAQKRLFFLDHFQDIGTSYNMPYILSIRGRMEVDRYKEVFKALISFHEALRTSFEVVAGEPVQRVHPRVDFEIECFDPEEVVDEYSSFILQRFIRPFDLSQAPLLRVGLREISREEYLLLFDMHHIIGDGTSMTILIEDFTRLFMGREPMFLKIQYKDFSLWQNGLFKSGVIKEQEEYWLNLYPDTRSVPILNLPTDYPRKQVFNFEGGTYSFSLNAEYTSLFREQAVESGVTLYMNLLAVFNVLLYKYSGQEDIVVGTGIAGRPHVDLEHIIGMFVNTLAIRNYPGGEKTYLEFLAEVKENCINAFENQDMQFEELVERISPGRASTKNPLFSVELNVQNFERPAPRPEEPGKAGNSPDNPIKPFGFEHTTSKFDLILFAREEGDEIDFRLEYASALFESSTIEKIARRYIEILQQVVKDRTIKIKDIDISVELAAVPRVELQTEFQL